MNGAPIPNLPAPFSAGLNQLLHQCLAENPWERPSARALHEKAAEYLKEGSWGEVVSQVKIVPPVHPVPEPIPVPTDSNNNSVVGIVLGALVIIVCFYLAFKDQFQSKPSSSGYTTSPSIAQPEVYSGPVDPEPLPESKPTTPPATPSNSERSSPSTSRNEKATTPEPRQSSRDKKPTETPKKSTPAPDPIQQLRDNMVRIDGGTFTMGCKDRRDKDCFDWEKPARTVQISSFSIGKYEVTQAQWRAVMGSDPPELNNKGCDQCPVERVSWNDVQEFVQKLNALTGERYRLPTEAEWEYAARGGNKSKGYLYSGSNNIDEVAWFSSNASSTRPVGGKKPNELGLYDMSGNVYEWCSDWYGTYPSKDEVNPKGPASASYRVFRGGSWLNYARGCRAANRRNGTPSGRTYIVGFRLAL
jgi:formylglycine-generating enzyme required for sulfatase activity